MKLRFLFLSIVISLLFVSVSHAATLTLPTSLTEIGAEAFYSDTSLDTVDSVENAESYQWRLYNGNKRIYDYEASAPKALTCYGYDLEPGTYEYTVTAKKE